MIINKQKLALSIALGCVSALSFADMALPPQAVPPAEPQQRPAPKPESTSIVLVYPEVEATSNHANGEKVSQKTYNEIYAMLADAVKNVENVVIINESPVAAGRKPAVSSEALSVADQPNGHFRIFAQIEPKLEDGKAILKLQLLRAGHSADAHDMAKPISEETIEIDPKNVRSAQEDIHDFLASELHMSDGQAQQAMGRPEMAMWVEVKNKDGSEGVKDGSKLVIYYKPDSNVYVNLYYVNSKNDIQRLIPSGLQKQNFAKANQIYRFPAQGEGLTVTGKGEDKIRVVYTRIPSGTGKDLGIKGGLQAKQAPIGVIPTQYPAVFTTSDLSRFFSLPDQVWNEYEISYTIK